MAASRTCGLPCRSGAFDAVVACLVFEHIDDYAEAIAEVARVLRPGGRFLSAEISGDLDGPEFPAMLTDWERVQTLMGATPDSLAKLPGMMRDVLGVLPPDETEAMWREAGFALPTPFFQAFMIRGWHAAKA